MDEAGKLALTENMPAETHPDAMVAWYLALHIFHGQLDNEEMADQYLRLAREIKPDAVKSVL